MPESSSILKGGNLELDPFARAGGSSVAKGFVSPQGMGQGFGSIFQAAMNLGGNDHVTRPHVENTWVHLCLNLIGDMAASVPLRRRQRADPKSKVIDGEDELTELLKRPNGFTNGKQLIKSLLFDYLNDGEQFWFLSDDSGVPFNSNGRQTPSSMPTMLTNIRGKLVEEPKPEDFERIGPTSRITHWTTRSGGEDVRFPVESVAQVKRYNPDSPIRGASLVSAIMRAVENDFQAQRLDEAVIRNGGTAGGFAIGFKEPITQKQSDAALDSYLNRRRDPSLKGAPLFLGGDAKVMPLGASVTDMQLQELRKWLRDQILAAFRVPMVLFGRSDEKGFSRSGQKEERLAFHEDVIYPLLCLIESELNANFMPLLPEPYRSQHLFFDDSALRVESLDIVIDRTLKLHKEGRVEINQAAELAGWKLDGPIEQEEPQMPPAFAAAEDQDGDDEPEGQDRKALRPIRRAMNQDERRAYLKRFDDALIPSDDNLAGAIREVFTDYLDTVQERISSVAEGSPLGRVWVSDAPEGQAIRHRAFTDEESLDVLFEALEPWERRILEDTTPLIAGLFLQQSEGLLAELGGDLAVSSTDPAARAFLATKTVRLTETVGTLRDDVRRAIFRVLSEGNDTPSTLQGAILERLEALSDQVTVMRDKLGTRARLIARTETTGIANGSRVLTMQANGTEEHEWLAADPVPESEGGTTRDSHHALDGKRVKVGTPFATGLRWPGDPNAPVGEIANCRCTTIPVVAEIEELAESEQAAEVAA